VLRFHSSLEGLTDKGVLCSRTHRAARDSDILRPVFGTVAGLMGTLVMLPIIFGYTICVYWIFSGKLRERETYH
jgi:hypothetical protein